MQIYQIYQVMHDPCDGLATCPGCNTIIDVYAFLVDLRNLQRCLSSKEILRHKDFRQMQQFGTEILCRTLLSHLHMSWPK